MKIAFFELEPWEQEHLSKGLSDSELLFFEEKLSPEHMAQLQDCEAISVFTDSQITKEVIGQLPQLKIVTTRSTGFDHVDVAAAKEKGIVVCNVPTYGENTVAEHTFGLILNLSRKIYQSIWSVREKGFVPDGLQGFDLMGKTLGVIGTGHIGSHVIRIGKGFEMNVVAFDAHPDKKLEKQLGFEYVSLEDLLKQSDIVTLHVPYNKNTHHLINSNNISLIKKGSYIINTARGGLIETSALVAALENGVLAGAGLDVLEEECYVKEERELLTKGFPAQCDVKTLVQNHILMKRQNVIVTPHNAFNSKEALERILQTTVENIQSFQKNKPINTVS